MTYTTKSGDSYDLIAYKIYGSEQYTPQLIAANPDHVQTFIFRAGVELNLPTINKAQRSVRLPWK